MWKCARCKKRVGTCFAHANVDFTFSVMYLLPTVHTVCLRCRALRHSEQVKDPVNFLVMADDDFQVWHDEQHLTGVCMSLDTDTFANRRSGFSSFFAVEDSWSTRPSEKRVHFIMLLFFKTQC